MSVNWKSLARRIPHQIQIRKAIYPILWADKIANGENVGLTEFDPKKIVVVSTLSDKQRVLTYLHETLHAASNEYDIGLTENQVLKLEKALYYALKPGNLFKK